MSNSNVCAPGLGCSPRQATRSCPVTSVTSEQPGFSPRIVTFAQRTFIRMQITFKRVVSAVMIVGGAITAYQILSRPQPIAPRQSVEETRANAQSFDQKIEVIETARNE